jgi:hypothetical protein
MTIQLEALTKFVLFSLAILFAGQSKFVVAAEIRTFSSSSEVAPKSLVIEGAIQEGDFEKFITMIKDGKGQISTIAIFSPGGDFYEAMKIGRAMRSLELESLVPSLDDKGGPECGFSRALPSPTESKNCICASACFMIHIAAVSKSGLHLVVHRPYFSSKQFGQLSERNAKKAFDLLQEKARTYMEEMGVPIRVQEDVLGTASDKGLVLDEKTVRTFFLGNLPYYDEWIRSKCSRFNAEEAGRYYEYTQRAINNPNKIRTIFSSDESADYVSLFRKKQEEMACGLKISSERRFSAYKTYFETAPSESDNYNFSKWSSAVKYLGRPFDEILAEERFAEERTAQSSILERGNTTTTPHVVISDSRLKQRTAMEVRIFSPVNPSSKFRQQVIEFLTKEWGKPVIVTSNRREWKKTGFKATLESNYKSENGLSDLLTISK